MLILCLCCFNSCFFFFFKQKTAYEMRISDWSSDVCSSDLCRSELGGIEWLDDPARSARRTRASLFLFRTFSRQDQDRTVAMAPIRTQGVDQAKAVHARHEIGRESCRERVCQYV